jgi:low affinity Fe/Cu permease
VVVILVWFSTDPMFEYSDTWQLIINTGTTIVTFLMVFLIQNTQNRDAKAIHLKLHECCAPSKAHARVWSISNSFRQRVERVAATVPAFARGKL